MKIREIKELVRGRKSPATELGENCFHINPPLDVASWCGTSSLGGDTIPRGTTCQINALRETNWDVRIVDRSGWFSGADFSAITK